MPGLLDPQGGPEFSLMGMLLGGRGYAGNWFAQRDQMQRVQQLQQQEQQERGAFAQKLVTSPEFDAYLKDPQSRDAAYKLWALGQAGPAAIANSQVSYLGQTLNDIGAREQAAYSSALQAGNIKLTADEQLRVDEVKRQRDQAEKNRALQLLADVRQNGGANEATKNIVFDAAAPGARPPNTSVEFDQNGQPYFIPSTGSDAHRDMMGKINARLGVIGNMEMAVQGLEDNTMTVDQWKAIRLDTLNYIRAAEKTGTLDEGTMQAFEMAFPEYSVTGLYDNKTRDAMKTYIDLTKAKIPQIAAEYSIPIDRIQAPNYRPKQVKPFDPDNPGGKTSAVKRPPAKFTPAEELVAPPSDRRPSALETFKEERRLLESYR